MVMQQTGFLFRFIDRYTYQILSYMAGASAYGIALHKYFCDDPLLSVDLNLQFRLTKITGKFGYEGIIVGGSLPPCHPIILFGQRAERFGSDTSHTNFFQPSMKLTSQAARQPCLAINRG